MTSGQTATLITLVVFFAAAASAAAAYLTARRAGSGKVGTSEASVLWAQAQDMRQMLLTEKQKAEEQRDKFIASFTDQILPVLTSINRLVTDLSDTVAGNTAVIRQLAAYVRQGGDRGTIPADSPGGARQGDGRP